MEIYYLFGRCIIYSNYQNDLVSLSRWDNIAQGEITIKNGISTLFTNDNVLVAKGKAIHNYLYHINITMWNPAFQLSKNESAIPKTFLTGKLIKSWEIRH